MRSNSEFYKVIDLVIQSILFIAFGYFLDGKGISYHIILLALAAWQISSWAVHFFIKTIKLFKNERLIYIIVSFIFLLVYFFVTRHIKENFIEARDAFGLTQYPLHEIILVSTGIIIAFWYYVICFREVKTFYKRNSNT